MSFVSDLSPGRVSDKDVFSNSDMYELLASGYSVMADHVLFIQDYLNKRGRLLNDPPFLKERAQLPRLVRS